MLTPCHHEMMLRVPTQGNAKWVKLGCAMLTTLLASPEGVRLLSVEDEFLPQIKLSFAQLDPVLVISSRFLRMADTTPSVQRRLAF